MGILNKNGDSQDRLKYEKILQKIDSDGNNKISYSEFLNLTIQHENLLTKENLQITFRNLDIDNNGSVTIDELKKAFQAGGNKKTDKFWKEFIKSVDKNGDGMIQLEEFEELMEKLIAGNK